MPKEELPPVSPEGMIDAGKYKAEEILKRVRGGKVVKSEPLSRGKREKDHTPPPLRAPRSSEGFVDYSGTSKAMQEFSREEIDKRLREEEEKKAELEALGKHIEDLMGEVKPEDKK